MDIRSIGSYAAQWVAPTPPEPAERAPRSRSPAISLENSIVAHRSGGGSAPSPEAGIYVPILPREKTVLPAERGKAADFPHPYPSPSELARLDASRQASLEPQAPSALEQAYGIAAADRPTIDVFA